MAAAKIPGQRFVADACSKRPDVDGVAANLSGFTAAEISTLPGTSDLTGLAVDLGDGSDTVSLANGINSLSAIGIENLNGSDFGGTPSDDTLTLLNTVSGLNVHLGDGSNTLGNLFGVNVVNGSASTDTLTISGQAGGTFDLGDGTDTVTFNTNVFNTTVLNTENINGSSTFDEIIIGNTRATRRSPRAGGADWVTASAGDDNVRFTSTTDSAAGAGDTVYYFDANDDTFNFSGISVSGGHIEYVDSGAFVSGSQASARLQNFGPDNDLLQIDTNGDGTADMDISLQNYTGTLNNNPSCRTKGSRRTSRSQIRKPRAKRGFFAFCNWGAAVCWVFELANPDFSMPRECAPREK
ncbi:M10 family metallopeptidase C-terminal domain-containing protein [Bradyrhizobium sp. AUGA SZCCT0042]|uniref:M10 family metallopeptidase C-terminal domain-containing protein n=1 Tax=Bradyrhizobium sp. AUGA SZCCT0042 TaxID=2807651 RepID=UPI001BAB6567|nr:hypothetical protein [Bradyrhizobium sp. AUGA SZCCT0042]MBR1300813.1 hypothetical protein [Bradyrhizobium sp. AUGA SZCCT0042]